MKKKRTIIALSLAMLMMIFNTMNAYANFSTGSKTKNFTHNSTAGNVNVLADVGNASGITGYKYKGTTYFGKKATLKNYVSGYYYDSNGYLCKYSDENTEYNTTVVSSGGWLSGSYVGECTADRKCCSKAYVNGSQKATVYHP